MARRALYREFFAARRDLHGASTNLNQLPHLGNQRRELPDGVADCISELGAAMDRLVHLAGLLAAHPKASPREAEER
jgi:Bacterial mobilisation protein (MobC)